MQDRGWIDLHSHILPQLDDGSDSVEMSLAMLYQMAEQGVDVVCATSHYYAKYSSIDLAQTAVPALIFEDIFPA